MTVCELRYSMAKKKRMSANVANLESLLRSKKLGDSLVSSRPLPVERLATTGMSELDEPLGGGLARGHLSEIVGPRSSGRTSALIAVLAAATDRGEVVALIDTFDNFDPISSHAAGVDLSRVLWVRGRQSVPRMASHCIDQAIKAAGLVLQTERFGVVAVDFAEAPVSVIRRLPFTTWLRLARAIEGSETIGIVVGPTAMGRSAVGRSIVLGTSHSTRWSGGGPRSRVFQGIDIDARVESTRYPLRLVRLTARDGYVWDKLAQDDNRRFMISGLRLHPYFTTTDSMTPD